MKKQPLQHVTCIIVITDVTLLLLLPGYYCNMTKTMQVCPGGFYCPAMSEFPLPCPLGHYCEIIMRNGSEIGASNGDTRNSIYVFL